MKRDESIQTQVDEAIDESFPASDPPSWMPGRTHITDKKLPEEEREAIESDLEERRQEARDEVCGCSGGKRH